ncbi:DsbA family protein [Patescibacteria group bacterium]
MNKVNQSNQGTMFIAGAIIIAGVIVAGAIVYSNNIKTEEVATVTEGTGTEEENVKRPGPDNVKEVTTDDHIVGSLDASVKLIEFSDIECPFCKRFHLSILDLMEEYKDGNQVAWVYRHFPLDALHSKARPQAEATECVAELGGNEKFWEYLNELYETTPSNNQFDMELLPVIAEQVGVNVDEFNKCFTERRFKDKVAGHLDDAISSGARGTPYSILVGPNGEKIAIAGAEPIDSIRAKIEALLTND